MTVTVLGLAGSHRRGGNTETLLDWCLDAAQAEGATVIKFRLCDLDLHGCRACETCLRTGACVQRDDMDRLYPHLRHADSIVLAAPVYFQGMPAVPKMMIDRCQPFWAIKYVLKEPIAEPGRPQRLGGFLCCAGTDYRQTFDGVRLVVRTLWHALDVAPAGEVVRASVDARGQICEHPEARAEAEELGRLLGRER